MRRYPPEVLQKLADSWIAEKRIEDALTAYTVAERKYNSRSGRENPHSVGVRARRAWCLVQLGRDAEGAQLYRDALAAKRQSGDREPPTAQMLMESLRAVEPPGGASPLK